MELEGDQMEWERTPDGIGRRPDGMGKDTRMEWEGYKLNYTLCSAVVTKDNITLRVGNGLLLEDQLVRYKWDIMSSIALSFVSGDIQGAMNYISKDELNIYNNTSDICHKGHIDSTLLPSGLM